MKLIKGFLITIAVVVILLISVKLLDHPNFYLFVLPGISLTTAVVMIGSKKYKSEGIGVIAALIFSYIALFILYIMLQGPM